MRDQSSPFVVTNSSISACARLHTRDQGVESSVCEIEKQEGNYSIASRRKGISARANYLGELFGGMAILSMERGCKAKLDLIKAGTNEEIEPF